MKLYYNILILTTFIFISCSQKHENNFENIAFETGDLIFRKGVGVKSRMVLHADSSGIYSHTGIIVKQNSTFQVVHVTPGERENGEKFDKIKMEPVRIFWRSDRAKHGAVYRLKDNFLGEKAAQEAVRFLQKGILFDHDYELSDSSEMYCTELIWQSYLIAGKDITFGKRSELNVPRYSGTYILPSDIYTNSEFILIYKF